MSASSSLTVRLPAKTRKSLDRAAKLTRHSRALIVKEALDRHLPGIVNDRVRAEGRNRMARLLAMAGAGAPYSSYKSADEVIKQIRKFRGDE